MPLPVGSGEDQESGEQDQQGTVYQPIAKIVQFPLLFECHGAHLENASPRRLNEEVQGVCREWGQIYFRILDSQGGGLVPFRTENKSVPI